MNPVISRRSPETPAHRVAVLLPPDVIALDLVVPLQMFGPWELGPRGSIPQENPYLVDLVDAGGSRCGDWLVAEEVLPLTALRTASTIIVPGSQDPSRPIDPAVAAALRSAHERGARIASICTGAFVLAEAGVLDGRTVSTHWAWSRQLQQLYPQVSVDAARLVVTDGPISTSGGVLAGVDLCLRLISDDLGQDTANAIARFVISPPHREGGQAVFAVPQSAADDEIVAAIAEWLRAHMTEPVSTESLAKRFHLSGRTLRRRFRNATGTSLMGWLAAERVATARRHLETTTWSIEDVAHASGFTSSESMRVHFVDRLHVSPSRYRLMFTESAEPSAAEADDPLSEQVR